LHQSFLVESVDNLYVAIRKASRTICTGSVVGVTDKCCIILQCYMTVCGDDVTMGVEKF